MSSLISMLYTGSSGIQTTQTMISVLGHNQANAKVEGYSRQRVNIASASVYGQTNGDFGVGVKVVEVIRIYDELLAKNVRTETTSLAYWESTQKHTGEIMARFDELKKHPTIGEYIQKYFDAWQDLSSLPNGKNDNSNVKRINLREISDTLCSKIREGAEFYKGKTKQINDDLKSSIEEINQMAVNISSLNKEISSIEAGPQHANDLRDKRDLIVDKLSKFVQVNTVEKSDGTINLFIGGAAIVENQEVNKLELRENEDENFDIYLTFDADPKGMKITEVFNSGKVGAELEMRDEVIPKYSKDLDDLAKTLIQETNIIHSKGQGTERFTNLTASNGVENPLYPLSSDIGELPFPVINGAFELKIYKQDGTVVDKVSIEVDPQTDTLASMAERINIAGAKSPGTFGASITPDNKLQIITANKETFAIGEDTSGFVVAAGLNNFFSGTDSSNISIDKNIQNNINFIASSLTGEPGDSSNAEAMVKLKFKRVSDDKQITIEQFYGVYSGSIAITKKEVDTFVKVKAQSLKSNIEEKLSISGVSLDDLAIDMLNFQRMFEANSRYINAVDEMLSLVVKSLGLVGR